MAKEDCGKWYCQKAPGFQRLAPSEYSLFDQGENYWPSKNEARANTAAFIEHNEDQRVGLGFEGWIAAIGYSDGPAHDYWVWEVDSRAKYLEYRWFDEPGEVGNLGDLHRGMAWQFPIVGVFTYEPTDEDLAQFREHDMPYIVLLDEEEPPEEPPVWDCKKPLEGIKSRHARVEAKLDYIICLLEDE